MSSAPAPFWALAAITWLNSLGSGLLWAGIPFITEHRYHFTRGENLTLALVESVIYVTVALLAGPVLRHLQRRGWSTRGWMGTILCTQMICVPLALAGITGVVLAACLLSAVGGALWPLMENYLTSGRHGHEMRRTIGHFNVAWMSATGAALLMMAPLMQSGNPQWGILALAPISGISLVLLRKLPRQPAPHSIEEHRTHVPPGYRPLLHALRFILPTSYVFIAVIGPLLPFGLKDLELEPALTTPLASLWMFVRMATTLVMAYLPFWHGRWGAVGMGVALLAAGFAMIVLAPNLLVMTLGLAAFGAGHGILYYAALYYSMAVGAAEIDAAGLFEALIGVGYIAGPAVALLVGEDGIRLVVATCVVAALAMLPAARTWLLVRRRPAHVA